MKTIFVVCQHGDEKAPYQIIRDNFEGKLQYFLANLEAFNKNQRYLESDLNRSFPGNKNGTFEEKLAVKILNKLKKYDAVVDLHTATCNSEPFIILTKLTRKHLKLVNKFDIKNVVLMSKSIANGKALIDHVPLGISLELGKEGLNVTNKVITHILACFRDQTYTNKNYFIVYDFLKKISEDEELNEKIVSFKLVKKGGKLTNKRSASFNFYPIMARAKTYQGILCLIAKKVSLKELTSVRINKVKT